ncbi:MAG: CaiB/BaiF CoA-transferase family protein [Sinimarinibacterium sp.]|jgi:crotonobetainyl-CoA:carnitine CoA-transferase CaiB-like acyl-CoA transferase
MTVAQRAPLQGVRVLDMTCFMAGPYATQLLGYLGAEIVKVERPGSGDPMRGLSLYRQNGMSAHFAAGNACKKSITLNLAHEDGLRTLRCLAGQADVFIENFRPGVMKRLGVDLEQLRLENPRLVVASIAGFGQTGPWKDWAAYDLIAQAVGGGMSLTGRPGEPPVRCGPVIGDLAAGVYAAVAIASALFARSVTGQGDAIDISMMDCQLSLLNYQAHFAWISGRSPQPEGDAHANIVPYQSFETQTSRLVVAVYGDPFWPGFCDAIKMSTLENDERFKTNTLRLQNRKDLVPLLVEQFKTRPREYWLQRLIDRGVPAAPLNDVIDALNNPQTEARHMAVQATGPDGAPMMLLGNPMKFASFDAAPSAPPLAGQHTAEVLREWLSMADADIQRLAAAGAI